MPCQRAMGRRLLLLLTRSSKRQANLPRDPKHAQTYLMLGNLYQQQGRMEEAQQAWANGAAIFPDNAELAAQVAASQQQD